jgi:hypothetical protein
MNIRLAVSVETHTGRKGTQSDCHTDMSTFIFILPVVLVLNIHKLLSCRVAPAISIPIPAIKWLFKSVELSSNLYTFLCIFYCYEVPLTYRDVLPTKWSDGLTSKWYSCLSEHGSFNFHLKYINLNQFHNVMPHLTVTFYKECVYLYKLYF